MTKLLLFSFFLLGAQSVFATCMKYPGFVLDADECHDRCIASPTTASFYDKNCWTCYCGSTHEECLLANED